MSFPGIEIRLTGPGGTYLYTNSLQAYLQAKLTARPEDPEGWSDVVGGEPGDPNAFRLVGDQTFRLEFRALDLTLPPDWRFEHTDPDDEEDESLAFDLTFDPSQLCAVCVAGLMHSDYGPPLKATDHTGKFIDTYGVEMTVEWARKLIARGGKLYTPESRELPLYAATLYRGTPLCAYDVEPALRGTSRFKF
jgi:hypothetical protein